MLHIKSYYNHFELNQTPNTYFHYNYFYNKYMINKYNWYSTISKNELTNIKNIIKTINYNGDKTDPNSYYNIYKYFLLQHNDVFNSKTQYIDLGSAPGGFIKFADKIDMLGIGITLDSKKNKSGLKMKYITDKYIYGDLLDNEFLENKTLVDGKVDFINCGAVYYDNKDQNIELVGKLFMNQLYIANKYLKNNGSIMIIILFFDLIYNGIKLIDFFINLGCNIFIYPVQPNFKTNQIYVLIKNITFTDDILVKLCGLIRMNYLPTCNKKLFYKKLDNIFNSSLLDIDSLKISYLINILKYNDYIIKKDTIISNILPILKLDIINKCKYDLEYLIYPNILSKHKTICLCCKNDIFENHLNKITNIRQKYITYSKLQVDKNNIIEITKDNLTVEILKNTRIIAITIIRLLDEILYKN